MEIPDVHYARNGEVAIAYQVIGEGPPDIVFARGFTGELISMWEHPLIARHPADLASIGRVLTIDKRGTGLSDRSREIATLETRMDDLRAVMDAVGSERAVLWCGHESARLAILFAATYPDRTAGLVLLEPSLSGRRSDDYPWAPDEAEWRERLREVRDGWGRRDFFERFAREMAPDAADDEAFRAWFVTHMRRSMSPGAALAFYRAMMESDVRDVLSAVRVPTLILFGPAQREPAEYAAAHIANSQLAELPRLRGPYTWILDETHAQSIALIGAFAKRVTPSLESDRVLATILFTDIVQSTARAKEVGDRAWRELLQRHHTAVRQRLTEFRGKELDVAGDGFFASFDGPGRAIRCACAIRDDLGQLDMNVRVGVHTGECERLDGKLSGIAVHVGARVSAEAEAGEVLVSSTVRDLVAGSDINFEDRGDHELRDVGVWRLYAVTGA